MGRMTDYIMIEEDYQLAQAIEEYHELLAREQYEAALADAKKFYAHTDATGTTVLCGNKGLADAQRAEDERRGGFAALVCGYGK